MPPMNMEQVLFDEQDGAHCVMGFRFDGQNVRVKLSSIREELVGPERSVEAVFPNAVIRRIDEGEAIRDEWPLELTSFGCERKGERWGFALNCETVEWVWESDWPTATCEDRVGIEQKISASPLSRLYEL